MPIMLIKKAQLDPRVRAKLEELGVDTVRSKLVAIMGVRTLAQEDDTEPIGDGLSASRREMQAWLTEKSEAEALWVRVGVIAALVAAIFAFLTWYQPH